MKRITYLTYDGILEPLGYSQVARVLLALAERGYAYRLVSFERKARLADEARVDAVARELEAAGIVWERFEYAEGGAKSFPLNAARGMSALAAHAATTSLVHARSYVAGFVAQQVGRLHRLPYLFDARGYWVDERREGGAFRRRLVLAVARRGERSLYEDAAAMVGLTALHVDDVVSGRFGRWRGGPTAAIPTCADYEVFRLREDAGDASPDPFFAGKLVVGIIGSLNFSYHSEATLELARRILALRSDAVLFIATQQRDEYIALATKAGIDPARVLVRSIAHREMPRWVRHVDVVPHLLIETPSKRGSMPTKLAELFASGVRPLHVGCNGEVGAWVRRAGTGVLLRDVGPEALEDAARAVGTMERDVDVLRAGRSITEAHFSLRSGVERYAALLSQLGIGGR